MHGGQDAFHQTQRIVRGRALLLKRGGKGVDLKRKIAKGVVAPGTAGAEAEIVLAQGGDDVREGLQRAQELIEKDDGGGEPGTA